MTSSSKAIPLRAESTWSSHGRRRGWGASPRGAGGAGADQSVFANCAVMSAHSPITGRWQRVETGRDGLFINYYRHNYVTYFWNSQSVQSIEIQDYLYSLPIEFAPPMYPFWSNLLRKSTIGRYLTNTLGKKAGVRDVTWYVQKPALWPNCLQHMLSWCVFDI